MSFGSIRLQSVVCSKIGEELPVGPAFLLAAIHCRRVGEAREKVFADPVEFLAPFSRCRANEIPFRSAKVFGNGIEPDLVANRLFAVVVSEFDVSIRKACFDRNFARRLIATCPSKRSLCDGIRTKKT